MMSDLVAGTAFEGPRYSGWGITSVAYASIFHRCTQLNDYMGGLRIESNSENLPLHFCFVHFVCKMHFDGHYV